VVLEYKLGWAHFLFMLAEYVEKRRDLDERFGTGDGAARAA
jgi:hypothetical protein